MITPWEAFSQWFENLPVSMRERLAHFFKLCTTDDTAQLAATPEESLESFRGWIRAMDFPLRVAAKVFYVRSVFDLVIFHYKELLSERETSLIPGGDLAYISSRQWAGIQDSWKKLRSKEMSDTYIHSWTSFMIKLQMEAN